MAAGGLSPRAGWGESEILRSLVVFFHGFAVTINLFLLNKKNRCLGVCWKRCWLAGLRAAGSPRAAGLEAGVGATGGPSRRAPRRHLSRDTGPCALVSRVLSGASTPVMPVNCSLAGPDPHPSPMQVGVRALTLPLIFSTRPDELTALTLGSLAFWTEIKAVRLSKHCFGQPGPVAFPPAPRSLHAPRVSSTGDTGIPPLSCRCRCLPGVLGPEKMSFGLSCKDLQK